MPEAGVFRAALRALRQVDPEAAAALVAHHGALQLRPHPATADPVAHAHDVIYVIASGQGQFHRGDAKAPFAPGDAVFVPAGDPHRFEPAAGAELSVWIAFWGRGGASR